MIEKLVKIQAELKAPKSQFNAFGKYKYRNVEDIQEALKPLLYKHGLLLSMSDEVKEVAGELFIEAVAVITDGENSIAAKAQAGIDVNKKGMDKSQAYGSSSSYARKYALSAMFLIDDGKDSDFHNTHGKQSNTTTAKASLEKNTDAYVKVVSALKGGSFTVADVKKKYTLTSEIENELNKL